MGWKAAGIIILFLVVLYACFPVYIMVKISISEPGEILTKNPPFLIHRATLEHWKDILFGGKLWLPLRKSLTVSTMTTILALALTIPGAYAVSRLPVQNLKYWIIISIFLTRMFPEVVIALPIAERFIRWGLFDTSPGLVLAHLIKVIPISAWILVNTYEVIPPELERSAAMDGANRWRALVHIVIPLASPGIAVAAIYSWLTSWEEFTFALFLNLKNKTMPLQVYYYIHRGDWFLTATYATLIALPVVIVTYALQRYLRPEYLAGAVKG